MDDISELSQLVLKERQGRDRGWWDQMADCFHPDSTINLSWFQGSGAEFVARSRAMRAAGGARPVHRASPPVIQIHVDRAVIEMPVAAEVRTKFHGVEGDLVSFMRLLYRAERKDGRWKIMNLTCIYERDTLTPAMPGTVLTLDLEKLASFRMPYRSLAYQLSQTGRSAGEDLYGDDQPDRVDALYDSTFEWMRA